MPITGKLEDIGLQDHSFSSEYRIFGPPGTGKTTTLADVISRDAAKYGSDRVLVTSFSKAAATELVSRSLPIDSERVGTLHSHCFAALGSPAIAEAHVEEWNRANPALALTPAKSVHPIMGIGDEGPLRGGDGLLQELNRLRGRMIPPEVWSTKVLDFERKWSAYKRAAGLMDFADLIEICLRDFPVAPGNPSVIFADEAQDMNPLQLNLLRKWGQRANYSVLAFDDDQTIFTFGGASAEAVLNPEIPETHKVILNQSYRIPRAVHRLASHLILQVTKRQEKVYAPRPEEGRVVHFSNGGYRSPEYFILPSAIKHLAQGKTIMFLASAAYMLEPLLAVLRKNGIPFHNPYRRESGLWNPLVLGRPSGPTDRILSLLGAHPGCTGKKRTWEGREVQFWTAWLAPTGILKAGSYDFLAANLGPLPSMAVLSEVFESQALESFLKAYADGYAALLTWWRAHLLPDFRQRTAFPLEAAIRYGRESLAAPKVVVGTIHSVKGGEADVVFLFPDLSRVAETNYRQHGAPRDSVLRVFYVGATRARETLYICSRESGLAVSI
jgi:DNA helicase II / ATP-dependent DNA helicase PcrA